MTSEEAIFREIAREDVSEAVSLMRTNFDEIVSKQTSPAIAACLRDLIGTRQYIEQYFGNIGKFFVLESENNIVGTIAIAYPQFSGHREFSEELPELRALYVLPSERMNGHGRTLVENLCKYAADEEFGGLIVSSGPAAEKFYKKAGFEKVGEETYTYPTNPPEKLTCPIMIKKF